MSTPLFSVIVPTHNGADRLESSLSTVQMQTFRDYELIVVCDACDDDSADIARTFTGKVIEVDFHRDGLTRNAGIDASTGKWLLFLDDDDWFLHEYCFEQLAEKIRNIESNNVDTVDFSFIWKGDGFKTPTRSKCYCMAWCRAWRRTFIGDNRFNDKPYGSDADFFDYMIRDNPNARVYFWDMPLYYYNYMRKGSLTQMDKTHVKLDIVITHYNEPWEIGRKLFDSIWLQECCDYNEVNIMLVQDGEEFALPWKELLSSYPFHVTVVTIKNHSGVSVARNVGIEHAVSDWIMFVDFDDLFADAASFSQILQLFPVTDDVDIIWCKYVREVPGHGRFTGISFNCEDNPDFRMVGKMFRVAFLNEHNIRFMKEHEEYADFIFNHLALSSTYDFKFVNFNAPFYPFIKRLRADGAFSTQSTLDRKIAGIIDRDILLADEMKRRGIQYKYMMWIARTILDAYHSILDSESDPDNTHGITPQALDFWRAHRDEFMSISTSDIEVAFEESQDELMTYIQSYYNDFHREYYIQNDMMPFEQYIDLLDQYAFGTAPAQPATPPESEHNDIIPAMLPATSNTGKRAVVYCGTKETYVNMIASVKSLLATTRVDKVFFLIEDDEFPYEIPDIIETRNVSTFSLFNPDGPNFSNVWTYMCLMRTAFPAMFPEYDKILSLDIDIVITEDVGCLWDIDLSDYYFAGVEENGHNNANANEFYANFGVIMMNLSKLRDDGVGDALVNAVNTEHFRCPEQDAFNKYCKGHMYKLPNDYNVTVYSHITGEPEKERILHYAGLKYWKHFLPVRKYYNLSWDEIMQLQERMSNG